jgi:predicted O-methyltransferase YrrM
MDITLTVEVLSTRSEKGLERTAKALTDQLRDRTMDITSTVEASSTRSEKGLERTAKALTDQLRDRTMDITSTVEASSTRSEKGLERTAKALTDQLRDRQRALLEGQLNQFQAMLNLFELVPLKAGAPRLGGWAASADVLLWLVDEMLTSKPKVVLECGSGASTVWLALAANKFGLPTRIIALEHDERFARATREHLMRHGLSDHAEVRLAELSPVGVPAGHRTPWYDVTSVKDVMDIGLLFVDGPPGDTGTDARLPAIPVLQKQLAETCTIVLDDLKRADERSAIDQWRRMLPDFTYAELDVEKGAAVLRRIATV